MEPVALLFFGSHPATPGARGERAVVSPSGEALVVDEHLRPRPVPFRLPERAGAILSVVTNENAWWVSTVDGALWRIAQSGGAVRDWPSPFPASSLWPLGEGSLLVTRSPERFAFAPPDPSEPLLFQVAEAGPSARRGTIHVPAHALLANVANAGSAVAVGDTWIFAPLAQHAVVALRGPGDTVWVQRGPHDDLAVPEPRFRMGPGGPMVDYQPWNLGLTLGPDGLLYRLRAGDSALTTRALDVLDPRTGRVVRSATLDSLDEVLAANARGRVYVADAASLAGAVPPTARESLPPFAFPLRGGGRVRSEDFAGRLLVVNFWASWCLPCRREMPALDSLRRWMRGQAAEVVGVNTDSDREDAEAFLRSVPVGFPVAFGGADLAGRYGYRGLPYTAVVDARGRVVKRFLGALTERDLAAIRLIITDEHERETPDRPLPNGASHAHGNRHVH